MTRLFSPISTVPLTIGRAIYKYRHCLYTQTSEDIKKQVDYSEKALLTCLALQERAKKRQARLLLNEDGVGMVDALVGIAIGIIVLVAVFSIAPVIGYNIDSSTPIPAASQWNSTTNTDLTTGVEIWTQSSNLLITALIISILALVIFAIMRLRNPAGAGGQ